MRKLLLILPIAAIAGCDTGITYVDGLRCIVVPDGYVLSDGGHHAKVDGRNVVNRLPACPAPQKPAIVESSSQGGSSSGGGGGNRTPGQTASEVTIEGVKVGGGDGAQAYQITVPTGQPSVTVTTGSFTINADGSVTGMRLLGDVQ